MSVVVEVVGQIVVGIHIKDMWVVSGGANSVGYIQDMWVESLWEA